VSATLNFGFKTSAPADGAELVDLWRRVLFNAENAPSCPCHGIVAGRLNPDAIETNMLTPMRKRFRDGGDKDLSEFLERRLRKSPFAGMRQPFEAWLRGINEAKLDESARARLNDELQAALKYYAEAQAEFVCE
jgi:hypothetical protein